MKKAFTLMEIMIVVVVIGIIASMAIPRYIATIERVRAAEGIDVLSKLLESQKLYFLEHNDYADTATLRLLPMDIETYQASPAYRMEFYNWEGRYSDYNPPTTDSLACIRRVNRKVVPAQCFYSLCVDQDSNIECSNAGCNGFPCTKLGRLAY